MISTNVSKPGMAVVITIIAVLIGLQSLLALPIKLLPDTTHPTLKIETLWRSASPFEVEANILEKQERVLRDIPGLEEMVSTANQGRGTISLSFAAGINKTELLVKVLSKLNNVKEFPIDAEPPQVTSASSSESLVFLFLRKLDGNHKSVDDYRDLVELTVRSQLESIQGVAGVQTFIGAEHELQITIDPLKAAALSIPLPSLIGALKNQDNITGGTVEVGRKNFVIRLSGADTPEKMEQTVLEWRNGRAIRLKDIATVGIANGKRESFAIFNGKSAVGLRLSREAGANVLATLDRVFTQMDSLNNGILAQHQLKLEKSFDPSVFINRALTMVSSNIVIGIFMAMAILLAFFRRWQPTLVITISVPISLLVTFIFMSAFDRTINVISLAGIAFASGMVMDAAIVVLESITHQMEAGKSVFQSCVDGTKKVWRALLTSTLTTVAIFLPISMTNDPAAQLFADLALTIAVSVSVSLLVAVFVIPVLCNKMFSAIGVDAVKTAGSQEHKDQQRWIRAEQFIRKLTSSQRKRMSWILVLVLSPIFVTSFMLPDLDYLPPLRKDSINTFMRFPPGAHLNLIEKEIADPMAARLQPYMDGKKSPELLNYYIAVSPGVMSMASRTTDQSKIGELNTLIKEEITAGFPDTQAFSSQGSITGKFGGNRSFTIHIQAEELDKLAIGSKKIIEMIKVRLDGAVVRASPAISAGQPELRLSVRQDRLGESGWSFQQVQDIIRILGDGLYLGEYFNGQTRIDKMLKSEALSSPTELLDVPLVTELGKQIYLGSIVELEQTTSPTLLKRVNRRRAISLTIVPPQHMTLGKAVEEITALVPQMQAQLPPGSDILLGKTADKLNHAVTNLIMLFVTAIALLCLIMTAMLGSFKESIIVALTLPLATIGGVLMLNGLNLFVHQALDLLTMIGFIILIGLVVNNAILLVSASRDFEQEGMELEDAVYRAVRNRFRPILVSTLTSIFGMLPLLMNPGTGSEIYRGLAAVVVGGMTFSLFFTLILIPCLLLLGAKKADQNNDHNNHNDHNTHNNSHSLKDASHA